MKNNNKQRLFEVMGKVDSSFKPKLNETYGTADPLGANKAKHIQENNQTDEFFPITTPLGSEDDKLFVSIVNQGIDSHLEGFTKSKFSQQGGRRIFNFHVSELPILLRRLEELGTEEALSWKDDIENYEDDSVNEIFGLSQKEKDTKALKQKIDQAKYEISKSSPAATAFAQPGANNTGDQIRQLMNVRLNMLKKTMPTVAELLPKLFDANQGYARATSGNVNGLVLSNWYFVVGNNGKIELDGNGNTIDGHDKEYLNQQLDKLLGQPLKEEDNLNNGFNLSDYFSNIWSKDKHLIDKVMSDPNLKAKYGKYLIMSPEEWSTIGQNELRQLWDDWNADSNDVVNEQSPKGGGVNPKYTHFAILKGISPNVDGKIVNGWDYSGYDQDELRSAKREYFFNDIQDMQINPKNVNIVTTKHLQKKGVNPFDFNYWYLSQKPENQQFNKLIYTM